MTELLTEKDLAAQLGLNHLTLRNWRNQKRGPVFVKLAHNCVRYRRSDVDNWLEQQANPSDWNQTLGRLHLADPKKVLEIAYGVYAAFKYVRGEEVDRKDACSLGQAVDELCSWAL